MTPLPALLERFRRGPELLAVVLTGVFGDEEDFVPAPGKWSARQVVAHLADAELHAAFSFRQILAEESPLLPSFDQEAWARNLDYERRKPKQSLESFRRTRSENYELLKDVPESAFDRTGRHAQLGTVTLRAMLEGYAEHAEQHARQLQTIRDAYKQAKGKK
jgi:hypothetical protein